MASIKGTIGIFESVFSKLNDKYFEGALEKPVITVSPDHTKVGAYGWCTNWRAWQDKAGGYYEINICADHLNRPFADLAETMLHEMVHLDNIAKGIKDTSRAGTYHNTKFKQTAEAHGLEVEKSDKYGWVNTKLAADTLEYIISLQLESDMHRSKEDKPGAADGTSKRKTSTRKYSCPDCGNSVRATKEVNIICGDCRIPMVTEDNSGEDADDDN